ncbi:Pimeloyl-ACP methyl ester carboxylesterase [Sphingobium faniae]|nr:Pimeloyl-ACP methyl ester carboxylesterase [Sphingobium faniae]
MTTIPACAARPYHVAVPDGKLRWIAQRVRDYPWDRMPDAGGWTCGTSVTFLRELADYWVDGFDWRAVERGLNRYPQFKAEIDGIDVHFYHVRSAMPDARPLLLLHGWPGSVVEFLHLVDALTDPVAHGGRERDAFHLVIPSLPGFAFSGKPPGPVAPGQMAHMFSALMTKTLGYEQFIVQGGDWGAIIATLMGHLDDGHVDGIHLNMVVPDFVREPQGIEEENWTRQRAATQRQESAYGLIQGTKPQTLGFAMTDSPVGVAAWIVEKFAGWSDLPRAPDGQPDIQAVYSFDQLLTNIMLYLVEDSFVTAAWIYRGFNDAFPASPFATGARCPAPTAIAAFHDPLMPPPPRSMADRNYNVVQWNDMPHGGHFAALERPRDLLDDLRRFAALLAKRSSPEDGS